MFNLSEGRNIVLVQVLLFLLLVFSGVLGYVLVQLTHLHLLYLNAIAIFYLALKFHIPPMSLFVISIFDEQLLGYPIGSLLALNSTVVLVIYIIKHRHRKLSY